MKARGYLWSLLVVLGLLVNAPSALADTGSVAGSTTQTDSGTGSDSHTVTWDLLDPGDDWTATVIRSVFPVFSSGDTSIGAESTVIGTMLAWLSAFAGAIAAMWVTYLWFNTNFRGAEKSQLLGDNQSQMSIVKIGLAALMMFPTASGFNGAQAVVVQSSLWSIGMARTIYSYAVKAIGPDGKAIAMPIVPGTKGIVLNLVKDEFCRSIINTASNNPDLIPAPSGRTIPALAGQTFGVVNYAYNMILGDGAPTCGAINLETPMAGQTNLAGVSVDTASMQRTILDSVLVSDIRGPVETVARNFWMSKKTQDLAPLLQIVTTATNDYTARLTQQAAQLRSQLQKAVGDRSATLGQWGLGTNGDATNTANRLDNIGWSGAGAYYLEFARLNGQTLSLMTATPNVTTPSYSGLGSALDSDIAPLVQSAHTFLANIDAMVATTDGMSAPGGNGDLYSGAMPGGDGSSIVTQLFRALHLNDYALQTLVGFMEPSGTDGYWTDPFGNLMSLGHWLITISVTAMGTASVLSSNAGTLGSGILSLMAGQPEGVVAAGLGHMVMQFFSTPVMLGCMAMLVPGLTIAFVLPMVPFVMWIAGITGWLVLVCEAMVAAPLWMLAHMTLGGEGLHGNARQGYALVFEVLFRPTLMLFGLFLGYFVFDASSWLVHETFGVAAGFALSHGWLVSNFLGMLLLVWMFVLLHMILAGVSFRLIAIVPNRVPQMLGFGGGERIDVDAFSRDVAAVGMAGAMQRMQESLRPNVNNGANSSPPSGTYGPKLGNRNGNNGGIGLDTTMNKNS
ncbi:DotA/TraY family protein [Acetobacter sacchari]|uniref:DotA/TraY family protein n=1 Tax=Acetobacter sacchari TaxID=2661687 RepID=A0ABS3LW77_9PROT|nr:DotA/TraY family protein [Acetobacter sacchari]MBO1360180.1 DotA/TraY family protein [Acetobacter sacchari]